MNTVSSCTSLLSIDYSSRKNFQPPGSRDDVDTESDLCFVTRLTEGISFIGGLIKFYTGRFFEEASGTERNIDYVYVQAEVEF